MKTMAATAAPPSRAAAPPADATGPDAGSQGSFAAVLGQAREPVKAAVDRAAKTQTGAAPAAEPKTPAKTGAGATRESVHDAHGEREGAATATDTTDTADAAEAALPVPGWPAPGASPQAPGADAAPAFAAPLGGDGAAMGIDNKLWLDEGAPLAHAATPGKARMVKAALPALAPTDMAPGKTDAAAAATATATATATSAASAAKPGADAAAMSVPTLAALPAVATHAPTSSPAAVGTAAAMPFAAHLAAAVNSPAFAPALAAQVSWLVQEGQQHARLTLNPADLGPVAVRIMLEGTQARIDFHAALASTRAAIEASLPTLAAALHDNGMTLAGGGVFDGQQRHHSTQTGQGGHSKSQAGPMAAENTAVGHAGDMPSGLEIGALQDRSRGRQRGLVDLVA